MPIALPVEKSVAMKSPRHLVIYSPPKTGKTSLFAELENSLLIDLEQGSDFVSAIRVKISNYKELHELCEEVKKAGNPYKYGIIDTASALEDQVNELALKLYQSTAMGKDFKGPNVLSLPNGAGYLYLRDAFDMMYGKVKDAFPRTILACHTKDKNITKGSSEVVANDIALTGKIKQLTCAYADAIGYMKRDGNKCVITFQTSDELTCGARAEHLRNQTITLSEIVDGQYKTYWNKIYID
jgi:hypothetical protein